MGLESKIVLEAALSHAAAVGHFERVNMHEPKNAPGNGLTAALWTQAYGPAIGLSSLSTTSMRLQLTLRIYQNALMDPPDMIDPVVMDAADALFDAYSGDFQLDGLVFEVDLLGNYGTPLSLIAGYINIDGKMNRIVDIHLPLIIADVYVQEA